MESAIVLPTLLAITFAQWAFYIIHLQPDWKADARMTRLSRRALNHEELYTQAVKHCRKEQRFFFLHLPTQIRRCIYSYLFNDPVFLVCSFAKDRSLHACDDWSDTARAQILCTCKTVQKEATKLMYRHSNWQFPSVSSLEYFTWHDVLSSKLSTVAKVTLTNLDAVQHFNQIAHRLNGLETLVIDVTFRIERFALLPVTQHASFARRVKETQLCRTAIKPHTMDSIPPRCCLFVVVELVCSLQDGRSTREMIAVNADIEQIHRDYRPVTDGVVLEYLEMPSAGDPDVLKVSDSD